MHTCPCCGQMLHALDLRVSLEFNVVIIGDRAVKMSAKQTEVAYALWKAFPNILNKSRLIAQVWGANSNIDEASMRNTIYQVRKKLQPHKWTIQGVILRGYRMRAL